MTANNWDDKGRSPNEAERGVAVTWWKPGRRTDPDTLEQEVGETDEAFEERKSKAAKGIYGKMGAHIQYPLSRTNGADYDVVDPIETHVPTGFGDPDEGLKAIAAAAAHRGIGMEFVDERPPEAVAYWNASENKCVVWKGIGGGDPRAVAHAAAHELGHGLLGHSTTAASETRSADKEAAAESFAMLVSAHHGVDVADMGAAYVKNWQASSGVDDMRAGGVAALRSAVKQFTGYLDALEELRDPDVAAA